MFHRRRMWMENRCFNFQKVFVLCGLLVLSTGSPFLFVSAQSGTTPSATSSEVNLEREKLQAIQNEIDVLRKEASRLAQQEHSILATLAQVELQTELQAHEIQLLELKLQQTEKDIEELQNSYGRQETALKKQKEYLTKRLVEAYKLGRMNYVKLLLQVNASNDLLRSYQYITYLAKDDARKVDSYRTSIRDMEQTRMRLEQENRNMVLLKQDLEQAQVALLQNKTEKVRLLSAIQDQKEVHLTALSDLRMAALQLQRHFTNADLPPPSAYIDPSMSLTQHKGLLPWPVRGRITRGFGTYRHPKFGTATVSNGIEISVAEGTDIQTVFEGQVVFAEWFKGYGQCVIISHPGGYYSLYAHNADLLVRRGDSVQRGQVVARVGSTGSLSGPSLYFEIRQKDQPLNPLQWLRRN